MLFVFIPIYRQAYTRIYETSRLCIIMQRMHLKLKTENTKRSITGQQHLGLRYAMYLNRKNRRKSTSLHPNVSYSVNDSFIIEKRFKQRTHI